ncbi:MAG: HlyD family type I secretion periplasmic adaptor subunit [Pseudomonadota bacterium]
MSQRYSAKVPLTIGFVALAVLVGLFGVWSLSARIAGAIIASGIVEVESNRQVIEHPDGGIVSEILAKDGAAVKAGDPLLKLDSELLLSELKIVEDQYFEFRARQARLIADRDGQSELTVGTELSELAAKNADRAEVIEGQQRLLIAQQENARSEIEQIEAQKNQIQKQISGIDAQLAAQNRQFELIDEERANTQALLEKGLSQATRVLALEREAARIQGSIGELNARSAQLSTRISELEISRLRINSQRQEQAIAELRDVEPRLLELAERRLALTTRLNRLTLRAPMDGIIYGSTVFAKNSVISRAEPVMYIVPQSQPLVFSARIESIHIDQVFAGQDASLRFPSLDQKFTPEISGFVTRVSADVFTDETSGFQYYEALLSAEESELLNLGDQVLLPGMPVEAFIKTGERTPMSYLLKPLSDYFSRALRES